MKKIDFKKDFKELYAPGDNPVLIKIPAMKFLMVDGCGNPNDSEGEYQDAVSILYALIYTIKMGCKFGKFDTGTEIFPDYTLPPLEGFWWMKDPNETNFTKKESFCWTSMLRLPDYITEEIFLQAKMKVKKKKPGLDVEKARFEVYEEGLCVHCTHHGSFDTEPATLAKMNQFMLDNNLVDDIESEYDNHIRRHHEIYLSDPRKVSNNNRKTIIRHPVKYRQ